MENRAKNFAELVLSDKVQFCYFPSTIAAAVVILASLGEKQDAPSQRVIEVHKYKYLLERKLLYLYIDPIEQINKYFEIEKKL